MIYYEITDATRTVHLTRLEETSPEGGGGFYHLWPNRVKEGQR